MRSSPDKEDRSLRPIALALTRVSLAVPVVVGCAAGGEGASSSADDTMLKGHPARPTRADAKRPGELVVHAWWQSNDHPPKRAAMLAQPATCTTGGNQQAPHRVGVRDGPVRLGLVASLARPGGNVTGISPLALPTPAAERPRWA